MSRLATLATRATGNSHFKGDKFLVLFWKNPENSHLELMTYLQANTFIITRKWLKLTHFYQPAQNSIVIAFKFTG